MILFLIFAFPIAVIGFMFYLMSRKGNLDEILRERADYDVWLRRNEISEQREKDLDHQTKMNEIQREREKLENLLKNK
jgi:hypothetical protein